MNLRKDQSYESTLQTFSQTSVGRAPRVPVSRHGDQDGSSENVRPTMSSSPNFITKTFLQKLKVTSQLLAMDVSAQVTMKDAAKCDKRCEWQNSANQENAERILRF